MQNVQNMWRERDLSLIGKTVMLKALAISKLVFLFSSLPKPDENIFCRLKKKIFNVFFGTTNDQISNIQFSQMKLNKVVLDSQTKKVSASL